MRPSICARASLPRADPRLPPDDETSANNLNSDQPSSDQGVTTMEVILLERIGKLGQMGDVVRVKDGYARNFLLPRRKALRATEDNKSKFEGMKGELQARSLEAKGVAGETAAKVDGKTYVVLRNASETGQLFGSVSPRDIAALLQADGAEINRSHVVLNAPIKSIGQYKAVSYTHLKLQK